MFNKKVVILYLFLFAIVASAKSQYFSSNPVRSYPRIGKRTGTSSNDDNLKLVNWEDIMKLYRNQVLKLANLLNNENINSNEAEMFFGNMDDFLEFQIYKLSKLAANEIKK